ncbi:DsrE family protein [Mesonia maritima]|uniref:Intracellular sulfur oxidation DsrE/DsrF family protein n=1 Tax=Mesonia maritima TaxID=1793873 RepID=A0ABU1K5K1_9FLAO|nr:sulfur reduction protein DsrE [Mesonia maritima]MDR6300893.1 intracellular sulfur oxidation DsrE/DsrF family protein [Mesonia maritima]
MKIFILSSLIIFCSFFSMNAQENLSHEKSTNYIVLTRKIPQLKPILITAEELKSENPSTFGKFEVVICGKTVKDLENPLAIESFLQQAEKLNVKIHACGFSLKKFKVDKTKLPAKLTIVENGILYNFKKQQEGYLSIEL